MISQRIIRLFSVEQHLKNIRALGIQSRNVLVNPSLSELYEIAFKLDSPSDIYTKQTYVSNKGALCADSGLKKDRIQKNEKIVKDAQTEKTVNWEGAKNAPLKKESFRLIEQFAIDYINHKHRCIIIDGYIGWNPETRLKVRSFCTRSYHALFMHNMLVRPTEKQLVQDFSKGADVHVFNAGEMSVSKNIEGLTDTAITALDLSERKLAILGTQFAGQMKKALFKIIHYTMPRKGVLTLRASATVSPNGNVTVICGRSAVGKNALFMENDRKLISDDELAWSDSGVEGVQGGCYIKVHGHSPAENRYVDNAIKYGTLLQNVNFLPGTRQVNYNDSSSTLNLRAVFPFKYLPHAQIPPVGKHPNNFILLSSDLSGVLPIVSKLTPEQAVFYFLSGYTTKINDPKNLESLFSPCYGESSLPLHPSVYAKLFYKKVKEHGTKVWLVNSGWSRNSSGVSQPISFKNIENVIEAIVSGSLDEVETTKLPIFGIEVPKEIKGVPQQLLSPGWDSKIEYNEELGALAIKFNKNYNERWRGKVGKLDDVLEAASPKNIMEKWDKELAFHLQHEQPDKSLRFEKKPVHPTVLPIDLEVIPDIKSIPLTWFDKRGDIVFNSDDAEEVRVRAGVEYFKPRRGVGYGLNLGPKMDLFDKWAVAFHGVRSLSSIVQILKTNLRPGAGQAYKSQQDIAKLKTVPVGVYFSPDILMALDYADQGNSFVLQCLVNPKSINITARKDYWVIQKSQDIIPYRIIKHPRKGT